LELRKAPTAINRRRFYFLPDFAAIHSPIAFKNSSLPGFVLEPKK
jgi:hypothetical protein